VIPNEVRHLLFPAAAAAPSENATGHCRATLLRTVPYEPDLSGSGPVKSVGYLWSGHPRSKGKIANAILQRLVDLAQKPLFFACGYHQCNLGICFFRLASGQPVFKYRGRTLYLGSSEIFIPDDSAVYCAPNLILHYIRDHHYLPPAAFCAAALSCPDPDSPEYREQIARAAPHLARQLFGP